MPPAADGAAGEVAFAILGRPFVAREVPAWLRVWLEEHWLHPEHAPPSYPFTIALDCRAADQAPGLLTGDEVCASLPGVTQIWRRQGLTWEWREGRSTVRLGFDAASASISAWGVDSPGAEATVALHLAICEAVRASGLIPLHAAAAIPPGGGNAATALLARTGEGKSTTLLRLHQAGWTPLAEDFSWIDPETGTLYGWDRGVYLWPGTIEEFVPSVAGKPWKSGRDGKLFLSYSDLGVTSTRAAALTRLALLSRTASGDAGWEPLAPAEGVRALWEGVGVPLAPASRAAAGEWIGSVVKRMPVERLRLGPRALSELAGP